MKLTQPQALNMNTLNPCPFCGSDNLVIYGSITYCAIQCSACRARGPEAFDLVSACDLWASIRVSPQVKPLVDALKYLAAECDDEMHASAAKKALAHATQLGL